MANNVLKVTGKVDGKEYLESTIAKGPYAFRDDITPESYASSGGAYWSSTSTLDLDYNLYLTNVKYMHNGDKVYNHPDCRDSGQDAFGFEYKSSTIQREDISGDMVMGYVSNGNVIKKVELNKTYPSGTVFVFSFYKAVEEISDPTGFMGYDRNSSDYILGFIKISEPANILLNMLAERPIYGVSKYYNDGEIITGVPITADSKAIRQIFNNRSYKIAFFRNSSSSSLAKSSTFGSVPLTSAFNGDVVKVVAKSSSTTILDGIADDKLSTDLDSVKETTYSDNTIKVPYDSKTLTIDKSAFTTANANYVSALADASDMRKYTVLGSTEEDITIDLVSIVNTHNPGDYVTVSFYAEKVNGAGYTDEISEAPVTLNIEVDRGVPQTITYSAGGGSGSVPASATALSGSSYAMASGAGLTKEENPFTSWTLSYTPFGETDSITRFVGGSESIVVPSTTNGSITATANYSGISAAKFTDSSSSVVTVTWDTNAPEGETAKFALDVPGDFNSTRTKMFNKINRIILSALVPGAPTDLTPTMSYMFDGWYTDLEPTPKSWTKSLTIGGRFLCVSTVMNLRKE